MYSALLHMVYCVEKLANICLCGLIIVLKLQNPQICFNQDPNKSLLAHPLTRRENGNE